ncbi:MAG TPA: Arc family DNA-binding protein [Acetobacteraceae bacterium]|nr:Arc family DNA-binding protein [Acetobacteraceae bacterium]
MVDFRPATTVDMLHTGARSDHAMPVNLSVKNAPDDVVQRLRERAQRNHRSLQGELMAIIEEAVRPARKLSPFEFWEEIQQFGVETRSEAAELIRRDRDRGHRPRDPD